MVCTFNARDTCFQDSVLWVFHEQGVLFFLPGTNKLFKQIMHPKPRLVLPVVHGV